MKWFKKLRKKFSEEKRKTYTGKRKIDLFRRRIIRYRKLDQVIEYAISFLKEFLNTPITGIYLWNEELGTFRDVIHSSNIEFKIIEPEILILSEYDLIILRKNVDLFQNESHKRIIFNLFEKTQSNILIPLLLNESLLGFIYANSNKDISTTEYFQMEEYRYFLISTISNTLIYKRLEDLIDSMENQIKERTEELKKTQAFLLQQEKMMTLGTMISGIAHELNTPIGAISASCINIISTLDLLLEYFFLKKEYQKFPEEFFDILYYFIYFVSIHKNQYRGNSYKVKKEIKNFLIQQGIDYNENLVQFLIDFFPNLPFVNDKFLINQENIFNKIIHIYHSLDEENKKMFLDILRKVASIILNLEIIHKSSHTISKLVKNLRSYSRSSQKEFALYDLLEILENTLGLLANTLKNNVEVKKEIEKIPKIECDQNQLQQLFTNLIVNAYQALHTSGVENPQILIKIKPLEETKVLIQIQDNGPGIPSEIMDKIWDPFFTTKPQGEGTGLGLGIVKNIVESHKGKIYCQSESGKTIFFVELPVSQPKENWNQRKIPHLGRYDWK